MTDERAPLSGVNKNKILATRCIHAAANENLDEFNRTLASIRDVDTAAGVITALSGIAANLYKDQLPDDYNEVLLLSLANLEMEQHMEDLDDESGDAR